MKANRYESIKRVVAQKDYLGVSPAWWIASMVAIICFAWAITWLLTNTAG